MKIYKPSFWNKPKSFVALVLLPISFLVEIFISIKKKFFNLGPENNWKNLQDKKIINEIETNFSAEMKELGYLN